MAFREAEIPERLNIDECQIADARIEDTRPSRSRVKVNAEGASRPDRPRRDAFNQAITDLIYQPFLRR
jgi:hypothetical protein